MKRMFSKLAGLSLSTLVLSFAVLSSVDASAEDFKMGAQMGAIGSGDASGIGFGAFIQVNPYETVGLRIDGTLANINGTSYLATTPSLVFFIPTSEEFRAGFLAGAGFYKFENQDVRFGIGGGALADFLVAKNLSVGGLFQVHNVFDSYSNVWNVFLTLNLTFGGEDGGWNW